MKSAILVKSNKPLVVADIDLPKKLEFGQVLVKVYYSGFCGAQINEIEAVKGDDKFLPHLLGHEGSGVVEKIGEGVKRVKAGDHVVLHWRKGSGIESNTPNYFWNGKKFKESHLRFSGDFFSGVAFLEFLRLSVNFPKAAKSRRPDQTHSPGLCARVPQTSSNLEPYTYSSDC